MKIIGLGDQLLFKKDFEILYFLKIYPIFVSEKMLISTRCIRGFMSNTIKKSWTVSNHGLYNSYIMHCRYCRFCLPRDEYTIPTTPNIIDKWVNAKVNPKRCGLFGQLRRRGGVKVSLLQISFSGHSNFGTSVSYESWHLQLKFETSLRSLRFILWPQEVSEVTQVRIVKK